MKTCSKCGVIKEDSEFRKWKGSCNACAALYTRTHYHNQPGRTGGSGNPRPPARTDGLKTCSICEEDKPVVEFRVISKANPKPRSACLECENERARERERENPEPRKASRKGWVKRNPKKVWSAEKKRRENNPAKHRQTRNKWRKKRYRRDPSFRVLTTLRKRLWEEVVKKRRGRRTQRAFDLLGCPWVWLEVHLESLFKPGMTWENHGPVWHIDHIKPCAAFDLTIPDQQRACFHWTNLQPLFALENLQKSDKYADSPEPANCRLE